MPCYTLYNRFAIIVNDIVKQLLSLQQSRDILSAGKKKSPRRSGTIFKITKFSKLNH